MISPLGAIGSIGGALGGATQMAGGIYGAIQAGNIRGQKYDFLNKQKSIWNHIEFPLLQKQNQEKMGDFNLATANTGVDVKSLGTGINRSEQSNRLQNFLTLEFEQKKNQFQATENNINNEYTGNLFSGVAGAVTGASSVANSLMRF